MKEVFISYSTVDAVQAETVRNVLEKNGLSCWMAPRDIPGGSNYTKEIPIAIRNCKVFVLILCDGFDNASIWNTKEHIEDLFARKEKEGWHNVVERNTPEKGIQKINEYIS